MTDLFNKYFVYSICFYKLQSVANGKLVNIPTDRKSVV